MSLTRKQVEQLQSHLAISGSLKREHQYALTTQLLATMDALEAAPPASDEVREALDALCDRALEDDPEFRADEVAGYRAILERAHAALKKEETQ